jgi:hypothetical protein
MSADNHFDIEKQYYEKRKKLTLSRARESEYITLPMSNTSSNNGSLNNSFLIDKGKQRCATILHFY